MLTFVNGASHRCAALPLTKASIPDKGQLSNPIRWRAQPLLMLPSALDMACDSHYSYGDAHGYR